MENAWHEPQSARACAVETRFSIFWKKGRIWASFFCLFVDLFQDFSLKVARVSGVPPQMLKKTPKWTPKGDQMEPRAVKVQPQGYKK